MQIVSAHGLVLLDATAHHYDTSGRQRVEHAALPLSVQSAQELVAALAEAIAEATAIDHPAQPGLWSGHALDQMAAAEPKRRRGTR